MSIVQNRKASHEFHVEERFQAGLVLHGWEAKAIRAGRANIKEAYVLLRNHEAWLFGAHITPLPAASTHVVADPVRTRKLLLQAAELDRLVGKVERAGYTLVPLDLHFSRGRVKLDVGLAKGKSQRDKRDTERERDWQRDRQRLMKQHRR